jgi:hypothetical protein
MNDQDERCMFVDLFLRGVAIYAIAVLWLFAITWKTNNQAFSCARICLPSSDYAMKDFFEMLSRRSVDRNDRLGLWFLGLRQEK